MGSRSCDDLRDTTWVAPTTRGVWKLFETMQKGGWSVTHLSNNYICPAQSDFSLVILPLLAPISLLIEKVDVRKHIQTLGQIH